MASNDDGDHGVGASAAPIGCDAEIFGSLSSLDEDGDIGFEVVTDEQQNGEEQGDRGDQGLEVNTEYPQPGVSWMGPDLEMSALDSMNTRNRELSTTSNAGSLKFVPLHEGFLRKVSTAKASVLGLGPGSRESADEVSKTKSRTESENSSSSDRSFGGLAKSARNKMVGVRFGESGKDCSSRMCTPSIAYANCLHKFRAARVRMQTSLAHMGIVGWVLFFIVPCLIDVLWVSLYFVERMQDLEIPNGPCFNLTAKPTSPFNTARFSWLIFTEIVLAYITAFIYIPFRILYAGSRKFRLIVWTNLIIDLLTITPFLIAAFYVPARTVYVPGFLRIWVWLFEVGFIVTKSTLRGEIMIFVAQILAVGITMIAFFEFFQNNYPMTPVLGLDTKVDSYSCTSFFLSTYWFMMTISTVGYGDVIPVNEAARLVTFFSIVIFLILLPSALNRISYFFTTSQDRRHKSYHRTEKRFIVVAGFVDEICLQHLLFYFNPRRHAERLARFVKHPSHEQEDSDKPHSAPKVHPHTSALLESNHVVVMAENAMSDSVLSKIDLGYMRTFLSVYEGSLLDQNDLGRCHIGRASAVFVLPTLHIYAEENSSFSTVGDRTVTASLGARGYGSTASTAIGGDTSVGADSALAAHSCSSASAAVRIALQQQRTRAIALTRERLYTRDYRTLLRAWSALENTLEEQLLVVVLFHEQNRQYLFDGIPHEALSDADSEPGFPGDGENPVYPGEDEDDSILVVSIDALQQEFMAASCIVPGITALLTNLFIGEEATLDLDTVSDVMNNLIGRNGDVSDDSDDEDKEEAIKAVAAIRAAQSASRASTPTAAANGDMVPLAASQVKAQVVRSSLAALTMKSSRNMEEHAMSLGDHRCTCESANSIDSSLRWYAASMKNEIRVMAIEHDNPFIGAKRYQVMRLLYDQLNVLLVAVIRCSAEFESVFDLELRIEEGDMAIVVGGCANLNKVFTIEAASYGDYRRHSSPRGDSVKQSRDAPHRPVTPKSTAARGRNLSSVKEENNIASPSSPKVEHPSRKLRMLDQAFIEDFAKDVLGKQAQGPEKAFSKHHIIVCSDTKSPIRYFIEMLRQCSITPQQRILWLIPEAPSTLAWDEVAQIEGLYWMMGESCRAEDLERAAINDASDVVLLADFAESMQPDPLDPNQPVESADADMHIIRSTRAIRALVEERNLRFLKVHTHVNSAESTKFVSHSMWKRIALLGAEVHKEEHVRLRSAHKLKTTGKRIFRRRGAAAKSKGGNKSVGNVETPGRGKSLRRFSTSGLRRSNTNTSSADASPEAPHELSQQTKLGQEEERVLLLKTQQALLNVANASSPLLFNESFASGEIWSASCFFFILCSVFVSGHPKLLWNFLIFLLQSSGRRTQSDSTSSTSVHGLRLIEIPHTLVGKPYYRVVRAFIRHNKAVVLGLFRGFGHGQRSTYAKPVVLVHPKPSLVVQPCDYVYVISNQA